MSPEQQAFILHHYGDLSVAQVFLDGPARAKEGCLGAYSDKLDFQTHGDGIGWRWPDQQRPDLPRHATDWPQHVTWREMADHWASRPPAPQQALRDAHDALVAQYRDHDARMRQINPNGYCGTDEATRAGLDAERHGHYARADHLRTVLHDALADCLPLAEGAAVQEVLFA